jgi:hypothetical protein
LLVLGVIIAVGAGLLVWYGLLLQRVRDQIGRHLAKL